MTVSQLQAQSPSCWGHDFRLTEAAPVWRHGRITSIERAVHETKAGARRQTSSRYGLPIFEIQVKLRDGEACGYVPIGSTRKPDATLSRWGEIAAAVYRTDDVPTKIAPAKIIGKLVRVRLEQRGSRHIVVAWAPAEPGLAPAQSWAEEQEARFERALAELGGEA